MIENRVKKILREGGLAFGTYVGGIADPQIVEIIGHAGFDAAFIDLEHTSFDLRDVQLMVMAAERMGISPIVRPPGFDLANRQGVFWYRGFSLSPDGKTFLTSVYRMKAHLWLMEDFDRPTRLLDLVWKR